MRARLKNDPATLDMTQDDYSFSPIDSGRRGSVACWNGRAPREGDYLILRNGERSSRYQVTDVDHCLNVDPATMWMASVTFAPRPEAELASGPGTAALGAPSGRP